eukprot:scaffold20118_cov47-Phaeocystis_antarctica.AAC.1
MASRLASRLEWSSLSNSSGMASSSAEQPQVGKTSESARREPSVAVSTREASTLPSTQKTARHLSRRVPLMLTDVAGFWREGILEQGVVSLEGNDLMRGDALCKMVVSGCNDGM